MESEKPKKSGFFKEVDLWLKIAIGLISVIGFVFTVFYQIQSNSESNIRQGQALKDGLIKVHESRTVIENRIEKQQSRNASKDKELHREIEGCNKQILDLTRKVYYIDGQLNGINK